MSLEQAVFGENKTLWEVLDAQDISNLSVEIGRVNEQLVTLGRTVDNNQVLLNDRVTLLDTKVDNNITLVTTLSNKIDNVEAQLMVLDTKVNTAVIDVQRVKDQLVLISDSISNLDDIANDALTISNRALANSVRNATDIITATNTSNEAFVLANDAKIQSQASISRLDVLEANQYRFTLLRGTNQYFFGYKINSTAWSSRRITFNVSRTTIINSNTSYPCTFIENNTSFNRNIRICATHDTFATTGVVVYPMLTGPCYTIFDGEPLSAQRLGYMSIL